MAVNSFILYNGKYYLKDDFGISPKNRAFYYGDGLFETMHANGTEIQFFDDHLVRLKYGMDILKMRIPECIENGAIKKEVIKLLHKNKLFQGVRIRLSVFRNDGGKYTPQSNEISYLAETEYIENEQYNFNHKGLVIDIFPDMHKPVNLFSNLKTANSLLYVMAGIYARENKLDDCILLNEKGNVTEGISSNIFIIKGKNLKTPALTEGPVAGIMRKQVLRIANSVGFIIHHENAITIDDLLKADEVFFTNSISGIQWVLSFKDKRYYNQNVKMLHEKLNAIAFGN